MKKEAKTLRDKIESMQKKMNEAQRNLKQAEEELFRYERRCNHQYGPTVYEPIHHPGYSYPGDPPGTMGVDRQLPGYVPARTEKRWKRECEICGKVEYTTRIKEKKTEMPDWPERGGCKDEK